MKLGGCWVVGSLHVNFSMAAAVAAAFCHHKNPGHLFSIYFIYIFLSLCVYPHIQVVLTDNGTPRLSSTTRVVITVLDVNDNGPVFQQKFYKAQIPKTAKIDDKLYQVTN